MILDIFKTFNTRHALALFLLFMLGAGVCASAKDKEEGKKEEGGEDTTAPAYDFSKIYVLSALKSRGEAPKTVMSDLKKFKGAKGKGKQLFAYEHVFKKSEAKEMKNGFLLQFIINRSSKASYSLRTDKGSVRLTPEVVYANYKLMAARDGKWKSFAKGKAVFFNLDKNHTYGEQLNWQILGAGLKVKCSPGKSREQGKVMLKGTIKNDFPFDVKNVHVTAHVRKNIPCKLAEFLAVDLIEAGKGKKFEIEVDMTSHANINVVDEKKKDKDKKPKDLGVFDENIRYTWSRAFVSSAEIETGEPEKKKADDKKNKDKKAGDKSDPKKSKKSDSKKAEDTSDKKSDEEKDKAEEK